MYCDCAFGSLKRPCRTDVLKFVLLLNYEHDFWKSRRVRCALWITVWNFEFLNWMLILRQNVISFFSNDLDGFFTFVGIRFMHSSWKFIRFLLPENCKPLSFQRILMHQLFVWTNHHCRSNIAIHTWPTRKTGNVLHMYITSENEARNEEILGMCVCSILWHCGYVRTFRYAFRNVPIISTDDT